MQHAHNCLTEHVVQQVSLRLLLRIAPRPANCLCAGVIIVENVLCCADVIKDIGHASRQEILNICGTISKCASRCIFPSGSAVYLVGHLLERCTSSQGYSLMLSVARHHQEEEEP